MLELSEWDLEGGERASPTFLIPAKSEQADPARKVVLNPDWAGLSLGAKPFLFLVLQVLICFQCPTGLCCGIFGDLHAQTESNIQRGFAVSASSASCFGNPWVGFAFWTAPN